jgi:hypothetical protein
MPTHRYLKPMCSLRSAGRKGALFGLRREAQRHAAFEWSESGVRKVQVVVLRLPRPNASCPYVCIGG